MRAGLLTERINIISPVLTTNDYGEQTTEWEVTYTTRARLVHDNGSRVINNGEVFYAYTKTFEIRDYVPVSNFDRIEWNNVQYRILDIEPDTKKMKKIIRVELVND